jgi:hypothetical protein
MKNDYQSGKTDFVSKKTCMVTKKHIFRHLRHHRRCIMKKKIENRKKNFPQFWTSRGGGHVTMLPPISRARGGNRINASVILNKTPLGTHS